MEIINKQKYNDLNLFSISLILFLMFSLKIGCWFVHNMPYKRKLLTKTDELNRQYRRRMSCFHLRCFLVCWDISSSIFMFVIRRSHRSFWNSLKSTYHNGKYQSISTSNNSKYIQINIKKCDFFFFLLSFVISKSSKTFVWKVAMIYDYMYVYTYNHISTYQNQVMSVGIDERNGTGQKLLCQYRLTETVNKKQ